MCASDSLIYLILKPSTETSANGWAQLLFHNH